MNDVVYSKTKLEHLTDYIVRRLKTDVLANKLDAWQESAKLILNGEDRGNGGFIICNWQYRAVISIEEFPHQKLDPRYLLALVACWLSEHDPNRDVEELGDPDVAVDVISHEAADVAIELTLEESVEMIPDPDGLIEFAGELYRVQSVPIDTAEEAEIRNEAAD